MNEREQEAIALADEVLKEWEGHISTHYVGCHKRHVACLASLIKDALEADGS